MDHIIVVHIAARIHTEQIQVVAALLIQHNPAVLHIHMAQTLAVVAPRTQHNLAVRHTLMAQIQVVAALLIVQAHVVVNTAHVPFVVHMEHSHAVQNMDIMHVAQQDILIIIIHAVKAIAQQHVVLMDLLFIHIVAVLLMDITHIKAELHVYSIMHALNMYVHRMEHVQRVLLMETA